jgi:flagellar FlgN protein
MHVVQHLERQLDSARRLLGIVLAQRDAIRAQDVEGVLARMAEVQAEVGARHRLELERDQIVRAAAMRAGLDPQDVDLDAVLLGCPGDEADRARMLSAELKGVLGEVAKAHEANRVLIRQELTFLSHLIRIVSGTPQAGYSQTGWTQAPQPARTIDARA